MVDRDKASVRKRELMKLYDSTAGGYNRRYEGIQHDKYRHFCGPVRRKDTILDVGCGTGLLLRVLGNSMPLLIGVDTSPRMIAIAYADLKKTRIEAELIRSDADSLPFRDRTFTKVASFTVLQNMVKPLATIREMARVAGKGGGLVLSCLKKKHDLGSLKRMVCTADSDLRITSEWDDDQEDIIVNATKLI